MDHGSINIGKKCIIQKNRAPDTYVEVCNKRGKREGRVKCRFAPQNGHGWRAATPLHNSTSIAHETHIITGTLFTERNSLPPLMSRETKHDVLSLILLF